MPDGSNVNIGPGEALGIDQRPLEPRHSRQVRRDLYLCGFAIILHPLQLFLQPLDLRQYLSSHGVETISLRPALVPAFR